MWSAGVILFVLLGGYPPFYDEHEPTLFDLIRKGQLRFDDPVWNAVSDGRAPCTVCLEAQNIVSETFCCSLLVLAHGHPLTRQAGGLAALGLRV